MATLLAWNQAFEKINKSNSDNKNVINKTILTNNNKTTLQTYTQIQNLGLEGILFEKIENPIIEIDKISNYIKEYNPLLFIYDPKTSEFQKGYLFGVKNIEEIKNWTKKNENDISKYEYILSPQILSTKNGFVGSVFSDGKGKIICETLHTPQISNHRNLSQGAELTNLDYIDFL